MKRSCCELPGCAVGYGEKPQTRSARPGLLALGTRIPWLRIFQNTTRQLREWRRRSQPPPTGAQIRGASCGRAWQRQVRSPVVLTLVYLRPSELDALVGAPLVPSGLAMRNPHCAHHGHSKPASRLCSFLDAARHDLEAFGWHHEARIGPVLGWIYSSVWSSRAWSPEPPPVHSLQVALRTL